MNGLIFAPVIITTLNRSEHFVRCVESLKRCKYADQTDLFISVDYPPAKKYEDGYQKICAYLEKGVEGFKSVHVYYQEKNLGPRLNGEYLREIIVQEYDRYIATEDDNEFSYNFLEYMDKGLMLFEKDEKVLNICAIQDHGPWELREDAAIYQQNCPAYGLGCWVKKEKELQRVVTDYLLTDLGNNPQKIKELWHKSKICYQQYVEGILCGKNPIFWRTPDELALCDIVRTIYALCADKYFIAPKISKSRNWGFDGSGVNMKKEKFDPCKVWELDTAPEFEYKISFEPERIIEYNQYIHDHMSRSIPWIFIYKAKIKYLAYVIRKCMNQKK